MELYMEKGPEGNESSKNNEEIEETDNSTASYKDKNNDSDLIKKVTENDSHEIGNDKKDLATQDIELLKQEESYSTKDTKILTLRLTDKLVKCMQQLESKVQEVQAEAATLSKKCDVVKNVFQDKDKQVQEQQEQQHPHKSKYSSFEKLKQTKDVKCFCGIRYTKCCELRRDLMSAIRELIPKYPQLLKDIDDINSQKMPHKSRRRLQREAKLKYNNEKTQKEVAITPTTTEAKRVTLSQNLEKTAKSVVSKKMNRNTNRVSKLLKKNLNNKDDPNNMEDVEIIKENSKNNNIKKNSQERMAQYINDMVKEYCSNNDINMKFELHYNINDDLNIYANKLVSAGYGRIVDAKIRINRKKNDQAFIEMSTDRETAERDGFIGLPVARQYAFDGDFVRAFVLNGKALPQHNLSSGVDNMKTLTRTTPSTTDNEVANINLKLDLMSLDASKSIVDEADNAHAKDNNNVNCDIYNKSIVEDEYDSVNISSKAFVINILEKNTILEIVGYINIHNTMTLKEYGKSIKFYKFHAIDKRVPIIYIKEVALSTQSATNILGTCKILHTDSHGYCMGELIETLGKAGDFTTELRAILHNNGLNHIKPYEARFNELSAEQLKDEATTDSNSESFKREDLTKQCIFTIDPLTARDLDDALSVEEITSNEYEVGVHISDVAHYVKENSELDNIVKERCTSIYMVNEVIHMLPKPFCMHCSLLPDQKKYAFSVFWRFSANGEILNAQPRFTRSIIRSCAQLAYEHAQYIIDNDKMDSEKIYEAKILPIIVNDFSTADIVKRVRILYKLSAVLRKERFDAGALTIKNSKLRFTFDTITMEPLSYEIEKRLEANFMIEEFMLLANQAVGKFIYEHYPEIAILRNHPPPLLRCMRDLSERMAAIGINIDYNSSKTLQASIERICRESQDPIAMNICLSTLLIKPMARAKYFCSEGKSGRELWHYALSIPIYTHFTSPIRRYPDILVHRLLAAGLNYCEAPKRTIDELHEIIRLCNETKYNAKNADDDSSKFFYMRYVRNKTQIIERCVITDIMANVMNVVTIETGYSFPIIFQNQKVSIDTSQVPKCVFIKEQKSKGTPLRLQVTSIVDIMLVVKDDRLHAYLVLSDKLQSLSNSKKKKLSK